jgi:2-polyprenyl-6-methoxyphenol hydroxylase-like FAD-dependent oxidoreductase
MTDEVAIVGAGPTGLLLAGDLAAAGVPCTVLERRAGESNLTRAFSVHARTLELLDARGLADGLLGTGTTVDRLHVIGGPVLDLRWLPSRFPFMLITPQYHAERLLARRARALGARVVEGVERRCRTPRTSAGSSPRWHTAARPPGAWTATTPSAGRSGAPRCGRAPRCSGWHSPAPRWYVRPVGRSRAP